MKAPKATIGFGPGRSKIAKAMRGYGMHEKRETKAMEKKEHKNRKKR